MKSRTVVVTGGFGALGRGVEQAAAMRAGAGMGAYAASKVGVAKLAEGLAEEFKDRVMVSYPR